MSLAIRCKELLVHWQNTSCNHEFYLWFITEKILCPVAAGRWDCGFPRRLDRGFLVENYRDGGTRWYSYLLFVNLWGMGFKASLMHFNFSRFLVNVFGKTIVKEYS